MWLLLPGIVGLHLVVEMIDRQAASAALEKDLQIVSQAMAQVHERIASMATADPSMHGPLAVSQPAQPFAAAGFASEIVAGAGRRFLLTSNSRSTRNSGRQQALASELRIQLSRRGIGNSGNAFAGRYFAVAGGTSRVGNRPLPSAATSIADGSATIVSELQ
ncbi:MAG: hypothetical protein OXB95_08975 [Rhodobacteraceae bacterium]|nr:hypothetical protein [Paracoccaceae bacterium]